MIHRANGGTTAPGGEEAVVEDSHPRDPEETLQAWASPGLDEPGMQGLQQGTAGAIAPAPPDQPSLSTSDARPGVEGEPGVAGLRVGSPPDAV